MDLILQNLISPVTFAFALGMLACWVRSDLEIPSAVYQGLLIFGLLLADQSEGAGMKAAIHDVITGESIFLMVGGLVIGALWGAEKVAGVAPFFIAPFKGVRCFFLLELGMVVAVGMGMGMAPGGAAVFGAMVGSASYIAAPAAVRLALPQASPRIYLTLSLGVIFPFNLAFGIPIFLYLAQNTAQFLS